MNDKLARQVEEMKKQTIGVELTATASVTAWRALPMPSSS